MQWVFISWAVLIIATLIMTALDGSQWLWISAILTIVKAITVSEVFMGLRTAPWPWRYSMMLYCALVPGACYLIIYL